MNQSKMFGRWVRTATVVMVGLTLLWPPAANAEPGPPPSPAPYPSPEPPSPYPSTALILQSYQQLPPEQFFIPNAYGAWFVSPTGLNCGIWDKGGFGCAGDIPGAPPGVDHIGWFNGNKAVHYGWTAAIQFRQGQAIIPLPQHSYFIFNGTTCVVTSADGTYCSRGMLRFFIEPTKTWVMG